MPKPNPPDLEHISLSSHMEIWDEYARAVLAASISFHGSHPTGSTSGARYAAEVADQMMTLRAQRMTISKEAILADKEAEKTKKKK